MYQIPELLKFPKLFHAFSEKSDGNMANSILGKVTDFDKVLVNRKTFLNSVNIPIESCVCMWVLGKDGVAIADKNNAGKSMTDYQKAIKIDSLITNRKNLYLFLLTADCAPVIIFDPQKEALGLVHVGWKGADLEIVKKVIKKMKTSFGCNPQDLVVGLGPAAGQDSFKKEDPSQLNDPRWTPYITKTTRGMYKIDFIGFCKKQLLDAGVEKENIYDSGIDTVKDKRFFSHVREGKLELALQGRFGCVVGIQNH